SIHSNGEKARVPWGSLIVDWSRARLFIEILADSCQRREGKAIGKHTGFLLWTSCRGSAEQRIAADYLVNRSMAAAGLRFSRLPSARFLSSTLPSARSRGPTRT